MNNPNPFVPKGSILEQQSKRRSRLKLAVFCSLAVGVVGLSAMLIQGCKREQPADTGETPTIDTNTLAVADTNAPTIDTNAPVLPPVASNTPPPVVVTPPPVETAGTEYSVVAGDTLAKIAKKFGVTVKALEAANPGVVPTKLKIKQKLTIPAGGGSAPAAALDTTGASAGEQIYVVKSGDSLSKIARHFGTTYKAIQAANNLPTTKIKVGDKLKIPAKAEAAAPVATAPEPAPIMPAPVSTNAPSPMPTH
jgi:LysM repeat protein